MFKHLSIRPNAFHEERELNINEMKMPLETDGQTDRNKAHKLLKKKKMREKNTNAKDGKLNHKK